MQPVAGEIVVRRARARGMWAVRCPSTTMFKTDAAQLADVVSNGRYTHREHAYILTSAQLALFRALVATGWTASSISGKLYDPEGRPHTNSEARAELRAKVKAERARIEET